MRAPILAAALLAAASAHAAEPLVVIDPGHGGARAGAKNAGGIAEKTIVMAVAKSTKRALEKAGVKVMMTRDGDEHVELDARVDAANAAGAAVFVSIHANSSPVTARRGSETYILSADASDEGAAAVSHLENEEGDEGVKPAAAVSKGDDVGFILDDLRRMTAHQDSARLAKNVQDALRSVGTLSPSRGLRQAPFRVLRGARMPAALVELGYLTNPAQGSALAADATQRAAGEAIAQGIVLFLRKAQ